MCRCKPCATRSTRWYRLARDGGTDVPPAGAVRAPTHQEPVNPARIVGVVVTGLAVAALVIVAALSLGGSTQIAPPDAAQPIVVGVVATPGEELTGATELPPLAMVLNDSVPDDIRSLSPSGQVARYRADAHDDDASSLMRLGAAEQRAGQQEAAADTYQRARAADPVSIAPLIGLAMVDAASGDAGMQRATTEMARLTRAHPGDQEAWFNRGWLATYRRDGDEVVESWRRAAELDGNTPIGRTATALLARIAEQAEQQGGAGAAD